MSKQIRSLRFVSRRLCHCAAMSAVCLLLSTSPGLAQIAYYPLDGDVLDASGGHDGTLGTATFVSGASAKIGSDALSVGTSDRVPLTIDDTVTDFGALANNFSISMWINPDVASGRIFGSDRDFSTSRNFAFGIDASNSNRLLLTTWGELDYDLPGSAPSIPTGSFSHVGVVLDSSNDATYYLNGVAIGTVTNTDPGNITTPTNPFFINGGSATDGTASGTYDGIIDDLALFNESLTAGDFALINGLGEVGGISLAELSDAQALAAEAPGTQGMIGGFLFEVVSGLGGSIGDFSGNVQDTNAIVFFADGSALVQQQLVPEPASIAIWSLIGLGMCGLRYYRVRRRK